MKTKGTQAAVSISTETSAHAPKQWIYRNLTPYRIQASFKKGGELPCRLGSPGCDDGVVKVLSISAHGEVVVPHEDAVELNTVAMRRLGQLELRPAPSCFWSNLPRAMVIYGWLAVALVATLWALLAGGGSAVPWRWIIATAIVIPVLALAVATWREAHLYRRFRRYRKDVNRSSLEGVESGTRIRSFVDGAPRQLAELAVLVGALLVAAVGLGVAIHLTTPLNDLVPVDYGSLVQLDNPFAGLDPVASASPAFWQLLVGHIAQWVLVSVAAIVPAAMYFQFDRQRLAAVQRQWIRDVFRLDPTVRTVRDIEAKYGSQIEASFGDVDPDSGLRLGRGRRSPIIVATILLVVGWFLVISTTKVPQLQEVTTTNGAQQLVWPDGGSFPVSAFFWPHLTAVGYAFLGAYVFSVLHVIRGYQRRDLHPKTYNTIVVRILTAYALALVVSVVYDGTYAEVVMFFVGFMPQSALVWLREKVSARSFKAIPLHEPAPLTELEGIDLYDRTRLAEEGVNNVEALAHADVIDLMSSTRISAAELVDWTDQALLYLKVGGDSARQAEGTPAADCAADARINVCHLRSFGIRTATDLIRARDAAKARAEEDALLSVLALPSPKQHPKLPRLQVVIDTLPAEQWFVQLWNWHVSEFAASDAWDHYLDGRDWTPQSMRRGDPPAAVTDLPGAA
jgi:hypothetical protein